MAASSATGSTTGDNLAMVSPAAPVRVNALRGRVVRGPYAAGSKSDRIALFLETAKGRFILRRRTGPAMDDAGLERFVGFEVECSGFLVGTALLAEEIRAMGAGIEG